MTTLADSGPWAITPSALRAIGVWAEDQPAPLADADPVAVEAMLAARDEAVYAEAIAVARGPARAGTVAIVPVLGPITKRDTLLSMVFGGTSTNRLTARMRDLAADESVDTVLLNVDSPGGQSAGLTELAFEIRRLAETKRVVAIANDLAASAAYWIASQANEIVATQHAIVGSVGAYLMHVDFSEALANDGIKVTYIASTPEKTYGNDTEPLAPGAREEMEAIVSEAYRLFVDDVAAGRSRATGQKVTAADVRANYGSGKVLMARDAKAAGMVDRIESYTQSIARLAGVRVDRSLADGAPVPEPEPVAETQVETDETSDTRVLDVTRAFKWRRIER